MTRALEKRVAFITGGSRGLGLAISHAYIAAGASLAICARDEGELDSARQELLAIARSDQRVEAFPGDVSNPDNVEGMIGDALAYFPRIHVLVNNAGIYGPKGLLEDSDWGSWVQAIEINLLGSVLMCRALLPHFKAHGYGKIIQLSGGGATSPLPRISAYAASKAAIVRFAETLAEEVRGDGIDVNAIAPGGLNTRMLEEVLEAGPEAVGQDFYSRMLEQNSTGGTPPELGAKLAVFLGSAASDGITGKLISAVWDPWDTLPDHLSDLQGADVYTLRRIVPQDRGMSWGEK